MPYQRDQDWNADTSRRLNQDWVDEQIREAEETLVFIGSRPAASVWLTVAGMMGGVFGGVLASAALWSSFWPVLMYLLVLPLAWLAMRRLTFALFGAAIRWHAAVVFFWTFLLGLVGVLAGHFSSWWLSYGLSAGAGLFIGLVFGGVAPQSIRNDDAWLAGLPLCAASTIVTTYLCRNVLTPSSIEAVALAGSVSGLILAAPMMAVLMKLWDVPHGLGKIAAICLQHDAYVPKAIEYLDHGIRMAPDDAELYRLRATAWSMAGNENRAETDWQKVFELQPKKADSYLARGQSALRRGELDRAVEWLRQAIELAPKNARAHHTLGLTLERSGNLDDAIEQFDRAITLAPRNGRAFADRARIHFLTGRHERAVDDCDQATELDDTLMAPYLTRAHALAALGHHDRAAMDYQRILDEGTGEELDEAARGMKAIGRSRD